MSILFAPISKRGTCIPSFWLIYNNFTPNLIRDVTFIDAPRDFYPRCEQKVALIFVDFYLSLRKHLKRAPLTRDICSFPIKALVNLSFFE